MKKITLTLSAIVLGSLASCTVTPKDTTTSTPTATNSKVNPLTIGKKYPSAYPYKQSKKIVISPYRPYNLIDLKGIKPGQLARDMSTAKRDPQTGKLVPDSAKIFRVPSPAPKPAPTKKES